MAVTITKNLTDLYNAESTSSWTTDDTVSTYTGFQREGTYCLGMQGSLGTVYAYKSITSTDLSNTVIYSWMNAGSVETKANGGFRIVVGDGTNRRAYYVGGSDDYGFQIGAWSCFVLDTASPPSNYSQEAGSSAPNFAAVTQVGVMFNVPIKAVGSGDNVFFDICRYGTGITIKGGTSGDRGTFDEIAADDASTSSGKAYGIIRELQSGVFGVQGSLIFGDSSGTSDTYFEDKSAIVIFEDRAVPTTWYKIQTVGNSTGTNSFILGEKSGSSGIKGCVIKSAGSAKVVLDLDQINVDEMKLYGCTFLDVGTTNLPPTASNIEVLSSTFESCGVVDPDTCTMKYCNFINADTEALLIDTSSHNVSLCNFISNPHGIDFAVSTTLDLNGCLFSGSDGSTLYDAKHSVSGSLTINAGTVDNITTNINGSYIEETGGGTTTVINSVTLSIHVEDESGNNLQDAQCFIDKKTRDVYTSTSGNSQGDTDFVVSESLASDIPASGWLRVHDVSAGDDHWYRYSSVSSSTKTFSLNTKVSGTCESGGSSTLLNDSGIGSTDIQEGDTIRNETDGSWAVVRSVSANSVTTTSLSGGTSNTWATGQTWSVHSLAITYTTSDKAYTPLMNEDTDSNGDASVSYNYGSDTDILIKIRKSPESGTKYKNFSTAGSIGSSGFSLDVILQEDDIAS